MSDGGYTLVEALASLAILALAVSGLAAGVQALTAGQRSVQARVDRVQALREGQLALDILMEGRGPFRSHQAERFVGDAQGFRFDCAQTSACAARIAVDQGQIALRIDAFGTTSVKRLAAGGPARFVYRGALGPATTWPPGRPERQPLRGVALLAGPADAEQVLLATRIWVEQPIDCQFDPILQDCR